MRVKDILDKMGKDLVYEIKNKIMEVLENANDKLKITF